MLPYDIVGVTLLFVLPIVSLSWSILYSQHKLTTINIENCTSYEKQYHIYDLLVLLCRARFDGRGRFEETIGVESVQDEPCSEDNVSFLLDIGDICRQVGEQVDKRCSNERREHWSSKSSFLNGAETFVHGKESSATTSNSSAATK